MARLSIILPSRDERFLVPTIHDIFRNARGEIEVIAVIDSDKWPEGWKQVTDQYPSLHTIFHGQPKGLRAAINSGVASAQSRGAKYVAKFDAHCAFGEGFDEILKADMDRDWVVIPRRKRLDADNWKLTETHKVDIDYHYLSFPDDPNDWGGKGLNGKPWDERSRERRDKPEYDLDSEMASQGSGWAMHTDYFYQLELMDQVNYGPFWNESQELLLKCWLSGGRGVINKKTWYAHLHKGKTHGRGYKLPESWLQQGATYTKRWMYNEAWSKQTLPFSWLIEHFWPVPSWPENWEEILYATRRPRTVSMASAGDTVPAVHADSGHSGLKIYQANYGVRNYDGDFIDVTERLQSLVKDNSLDIVVNNSTLCPNQNPFRGKRKRLHVVYSIDGVERVERVVEEKDWLIIGPVGTGSGGRISDVDLTAKRNRSFSTPLPYVTGSQPIEVLGSRVAAGFIAKRDGREDNVQTVRDTLQLLDVEAMRPKEVPVPMSAPALNDYLIRKFSISPQRLRGPMPIELRDFHRNDLAQLFAELGFKRGAEIGVAEGNYSEVLLKANPECELLLVDPWHAYSENPQNKTKKKHEFAYQETLRKTKPYKMAVPIMDTSMEYVRNVVDESLDFCYIDGNHLFDYVIQDLIEWSKRVRSGGIVSGDDYYALDQKRWVGGGVVEAVQAYTNAHRIPIWYIFQGHKSTDFMWVKP